jgi:nucleoside-diphosphate-sugar epimerase
MRVLITGASGCVGRYMVEDFLEHTDHELVLLVRDRGRMPLPEGAEARVTVLEHDLRDLDGYGPKLGRIDCAFLVATSWGGADAHEITCDANLALTDRLVAEGCAQIFYFATASVLTPGSGTPFEPAGAHGTDYIRSKYALMQGMEARVAQAKPTEIVGIFPTLVFGGRSEAPAIPFSHFANLMNELRRYAWLLRFLSAEARFNLIHAADIARVCRRVAGATGQPRHLILGNPAVSVDTFMAQFLGALGRNKRTLWRITRGQADLLLKLIPVIRLSDWDRLCLDYPDQSHPAAVNPADYGEPVVMPDLASGLVRIGFSPR